jgi:hypothetical protein
MRLPDRCELAFDGWKGCWQWQVSRALAHIYIHVRFYLICSHVVHNQTRKLELS